MTVPPSEGFPPPYDPGQPPYNPVQPGYGPVQPGYAPPAPPKKSNTLRTVLIIVGIVLVLCCGGLAVGGFFLFRTVKDAIGPVQDSAVSFVQDLEHDDPGSAYDKLCAATQARFPRELFIAGVTAQPRITSHKTTGVNVNSTNGETTGTVRMDLTQEGGFVDQHTFPMVKEDGVWKVCGNPY